MRLFRAPLAIVVALAVGLTGATAIAQQPKPTASASAKAAPSASATAGPASSSAPAASAQPAASGSAVAPPEGPLPSGHPPVEQPADPRNPHAGNPHAGNPHGGAGGRQAPPGFFQAPDDFARDDPELPPGTIVVTVADAEDKAIPNAQLQLGILRNTVAKGESRERLVRDADENGQLRLDGLEIGSGVTYRVSTINGPATYAVTPFALNDKAGKRVVLHSYDVTNEIKDGMRIGMLGMVYLSLREDTMSIEHLFNVVNAEPVSWVPEDVVIELPYGFKAFTKPETMEDTRFDQVPDKGASLHGTFKPGRHSTTFRYQVPLSGDATQTFRIEMPPQVLHLQVMVESSKSMTIDAKGFPPAQKNKNRDGKKILYTERQVERGGDDISVLELTVSGLPVPSPARYIALAMAILAVIGGGVYAAQRHEAKDMADDTRADLVDAQRALLDEIVELERLHKAGTIGPKTYARLRVALLDALARILDMLEPAKGPEMPPNPEEPRERPARRASTRGREPAVGA